MREYPISILIEHMANMAEKEADADSTEVFELHFRLH